MKLERLEVRLRPKNPAEQELIEALEAQDGIYGGKNELMRECLRRGYTALKQKMESLSGTGDEVATLDALAQTFASGEYGYRVVKTYLDARNHAKAGSDGQPSDKVVAASVAADPVQTVAEPPSAVPVAPEVQQQAAQAALDAVVADVAPAQAPQQPEQAEQPAAPVPADGAGEGAPKRKVDWSRMRGLAGSGGGEGGES
ncbi:hypothetical protein D7249_25065 [Stutzerimonas stutzeri]|uniref:hypothetical protein n=1 Tax=Comamonas sp. TaxID=34028 RepID=UPI0012C4EFFF|nr:hypothetical protein [Comamonas sp.]MCB3688311.1 hypothetical protein [Klebsiella pneumoniae]MPS90255.1 hypothetical protein [Comamonas sp.]